MAGEWRECPLGEVIELKRGYDLPQQDRRPGTALVVSSSGVTDHHAEAIVKGPGVVTGRYGTLGKVFYIEQDFWPLNTTLYVHDFKSNDPRFIGYLLRVLDFLAYSDKAAVPGLNRNHLHQARVRVPVDVAEQRAIAHILGTLDDKIELNRRMSDTLEQMARALFKSWFVDFDPVRAKCRGGLPWPPHEGQARRPAPTRWQWAQHILDLFPERLVDSELGEIPEGWNVVPLHQICDINPSRRLAKGEVAPYLDMANMPTRGHVPDGIIERPFSSGTRFTNGDTLLARITPCLENGKTAFVDFLAPGQVGWGSTEFVILRPKSPVPPEFGYCLARDPAFREFAIQNMTGTSGRQRVQSAALAGYLLFAPPGTVAIAFGNLVRPLLVRASQAHNEARNLAALRDALLPKLISGELRVKDAERFLNERGL